jgi:RecB family exonuclease
MDAVSIALVTGPANAGKAQVVLDAVRGHVAHGEEPLLVVPTEADQARYRRELAEAGLALGARVERFEGLLAEVLACAGETRTPLGTLAREHVLARIADARPGMASALARFVAELETQRVTPARLRGALSALKAAEAGTGKQQPREDEQPSARSPYGERAGGEPPSAAQPSGEQATLERLCDVFERYHEALANMRRADRELRVTSALDALRRKPALWGSKPVLLYGFDDLTELQLDAIETLGGVVGARVTVSLAYEPGRVVFAGRAAAFQRLAPLADAHTALAARAEYYTPHSREALHHLERSLLSDDATLVEPGEAVRLLEGGSPRAELELVAGELRALLDEGVEAGEIAIVHRAPDTIAGLLGEVLEDFDIPYAMRERVRFVHTAIGRGLLGLLRCAVGSARTGGGVVGSARTGDGAVGSARTGDGAVGTGRTDDGAMGEGDLDDLLAWLRAPGVLDKPELADRLEAKARRRGVVSAERARALWEAEHWPLDRIDRVREAAAEGTPALVDVLAGELQWLFCAPRRAVAAVLGADELDEARALAGGRRTLEELRELARLAPELAPSPDELIKALERLELSGGELSGEGRVAVVDPLSLRARRVRMVYVCGLQEGVFPAPGTPHALLGEEDRRRLAYTSGLRLQGEPDALAAERYLLYALTSRPEERLTLSWHTAGEDGEPRAPSLFVDDVCDLFSGTLREGTVRRAAGAAGWPGPGAPAGAMQAREAVFALSGAPVLFAPEFATPSLSASTALVSRSPTGVGVPHSIQPLHDERVLVELRRRVLWSVSSLESWAGCPVKWFVERLLRGDEIDPNPEPIARGGLAHAALRQTLERLREHTGSARLTPASVGLAKRLLREALVEQEPNHPLSPAPERVPGARRRLAVELERYLECAAEQAGALEPRYLELEFGFGDETGGERGRDGEVEALPPLDLGEGVLLRGRIDRVDVGPGGEAVVYDYKGSSAPPSAKWAGDRAWQVALYMSAVRQLLGHAPVGGFYQPLAGRDIRPRGVLDGDSGVGLDCVRTDRVEHDALEQLLEECRAAARAAAAEAKSGALEPRPGTCAYGGGCAYPTICRCEH